MKKLLSLAFVAALLAGSASVVFAQGLPATPQTYVGSGTSNGVDAINRLTSFTNSIWYYLSSGGGGGSGCTTQTVTFSGGATGYSFSPATFTVCGSSGGGGGGGGSVTPAGNAGDFQINNGTGGLGALTIVPVAQGGTGGSGAVRVPTSADTLVLSDLGNVVELSSASAITETVPNNTAVAFPIGTQINVIQYGAGAASIVAASGVTLRYLSTLNFQAQYALVTLIKIGTNEWKVSGELN